MTGPRAPSAIVEAVGTLLAAAPPAHRPVLTAAAERIAAARYRTWAEQVGDGDVRERLLACAAREEDIASRVEAMTPGAAAIQEAFLADHPDLEARYRSLFSGLSLAEQLALQAGAERTGAAFWRSVAGTEADPERGAVYRACALLEEESAGVLDELVARGAAALHPAAASTDDRP